MVSRKDFPSPDKKRVATVFEMCCYCTTGYFPQLSVHGPKEKIGESGNVLAGGPSDTITVKWTSPTNLLVEFSHLHEKKESTTVTKTKNKPASQSCSRKRRGIAKPKHSTKNHP